MTSSTFLKQQSGNTEANCGGAILTSEESKTAEHNWCYFRFKQDLDFEIVSLLGLDSIFNWNCWIDRRLVTVQ